MKVISTFRFSQKRFKTLAWSERWADSFGYMARGASVLVYGASGNGKTEFCCQFVFEISKQGRCVYISKEQGCSHSLQSAFARNGLLKNRNVQLSEGAAVEELIALIHGRRKPLLIVVDSLDVLNWKIEEVRMLMQAAAGKTLLLMVARADGREPNKQVSRDCKYDAEVKIRVHKYVAFGDSRFGGTEPFVIYEEKAIPHHPFLNGT